MNLRVLFSSHGWIACFQNEVSSRDKHTSLIPHWGSQAVISLANLTGSFLSCYAFTFFFLQTCPYISEMMALHEDKSLVCSQGRLAHNMYRERFQFATSYLVCFGQSPWLCRWTLLSHDRHLLFINPSAIKKTKNKNTNTHFCFTVIVRRITMDLYNDSLFFSPCNFLHFDPSIYLSSNLVL